MVYKHLKELVWQSHHTAMECFLGWHPDLYSQAAPTG